MKIGVIGGGAAGFMSAFGASENGAHVTILERKDRVLKKVLATGNGRCNFTNESISRSNYYGRKTEFTDYAINTFTPKKTIERFVAMGIPHKVEENGNVYPMSGQASSVVDMFRLEAERLGIDVVTDFDVAKILKKGATFSVYSADGSCLKFDRVIIACGGKASPELGSNGSGYELLKSFGHSITELQPALVQLKTDKDSIKGLSGIKSEALITAFHKNKAIATEQEELLFTDYGISGPAVFNLSYLFALYKDLVFCVDFLPFFTEDELIEMLKQRREQLSHLTMENFLNGVLIKKLGQFLIKRAGIQKLSMPVCDFDDDCIYRLADQIKNYKIKILDTTGFRNAQVTAGGVVTDEFDDKTMESKIIDGLYAAGEIFDIFGDCGGYNLQWAWSSGYLAGISAAMKGLI